MAPLPTVFILRNARTNIGATDSSNKTTNIEPLVDYTFCFRP